MSFEEPIENSNGRISVEQFFDALAIASDIPELRFSALSIARTRTDEPESLKQRLAIVGLATCFGLEALAVGYCPKSELSSVKTLMDATREILKRLFVRFEGMGELGMGELGKDLAETEGLAGAVARFADPPRTMDPLAFESLWLDALEIGIGRLHSGASIKCPRSASELAIAGYRLGGSSQRVDQSLDVYEIAVRTKSLLGGSAGFELALQVGRWIGAHEAFLKDAGDSITLKSFNARASTCIRRYFGVYTRAEEIEQADSWSRWLGCASGWLASLTHFDPTESEARSRVVVGLDAASEVSVVSQLSMCFGVSILTTFDRAREGAALWSQIIARGTTGEIEDDDDEENEEDDAAYAESGEARVVTLAQASIKKLASEIANALAVQAR